MTNQDQRPVTVNINIETKGCRWPAIAVAIVLITLALVALLMRAYWTLGGSAILPQAVQAQPSPPASEGSVGQGQAQETRVREALRKEGYEQPLGDSDIAIRQNLGLKANEGRIADFLGRHPTLNRWLVAESKGSDIESAVGQIRNTAQLLWRRGLGADLTNTDLRLYTTQEQYNRLLASVDKQIGYGVQNGYLGYTNELDVWVYETVQGLKILVQVAP